MSRRTRADKRAILPEPKYSSRLLAKFINVIMRDGKKSIAETIVYDALETLVQKLGQPPEKAPELFKEVLENLKPVVEVRSRRVGGATYQVPMEVRPIRAQALAMKWIVNSAKQRKEKTMKERVANELIDAFNNKGNAVKKREDIHKMAESNRAFSHFRW